MDGVQVVGGEAGVLPLVCLHHMLDEQPPRRGGVDTGIGRQGSAGPLGPGDPGLGLACSATLQGDTLPHQHLCILGLDHKTGPRWGRKVGDEIEKERQKKIETKYLSDNMGETKKAYSLPHKALSCTCPLDLSRINIGSYTEPYFFFLMIML